MMLFASIVGWFGVSVFAVTVGLIFAVVIIGAVQSDRLRRRIAKNLCIVCGEPAEIMTGYICSHNPDPPWRWCSERPLPMCLHHIGESGGHLYCERHFHDPNASVPERDNIDAVIRNSR